MRIFAFVHFTFLLILCNAMTAYSGGAACTNDIECNGYEGGGTCYFENNSSGICLCTKKYAKPDCTYKRKEQLVAFGLSWLFPVLPGVGRIYLGRKEGIGEMVTYLICVILAIILTCLAVGNFDECSGFFAVVFGIGAFSMLIWGIVDMILIGTGQMDDDNGFEMYMNL